ncbi:hypothetical protein Efla_001376 [Eimeria flavescens]
MATWDFRSKALTVGAGERKNTLNLEGRQTAPDERPNDLDRQIGNKENKINADSTRNHTEDDIQRVGPQEAKALGTDPVDEPPESAAMENAIRVVLQEVTTKLEPPGKSKNEDNGDGMCEGILNTWTNP